MVDDSSPDGTGILVLNLKHKYPNLHLLTNPGKVGLGEAYRRGMNYALDNLNADVLIEFDADLSHDPKKITPMLNRLDQGHDLVLGSRYLPGGSIPHNWGRHRKLLSVGGNFLVRLILFDFGITDWTTGFRVMKGQVARTVLPATDIPRFSGYTFQIGFLHTARKLGFKVTEVPFKFKDRTLGKSKLGPEFIKNTLQYLLMARIKELFNHRLFKFVVVGTLGAAVQLSSLQLFRSFMPFQAATFFSIEMAILSNFIWSNLWTFSDRKLPLSQIPAKFLQFNLTSAGSILIQQAVAFIGETFIGLKYLLTLPLLGFDIDTGILFAVTGILLGMFWNFFAYSRIIWKKAGSIKSKTGSKKTAKV